MELKSRREYIKEAFKMLREPMEFGYSEQSPLGFCLTTNLNGVIASEMREIATNIVQNNIDSKVKILGGFKVFVMINPDNFKNDKELFQLCEGLKKYINTRLKNLSIFRRENEEEIVKKEREEELRGQIKNNSLLKEIYQLGYEDGQRT